MDTKSLSSRRVHWAQKLSRYYFQINYCQSKANKVANALSWYLQQSAEEKKTFRAENFKILHRLQFLLTNTSLSGLTLSKPNLSPLHQVLISRTHVFPQLHQFWNTFRSKIANEGSYTTSIGGMRLRLQEL